MRNRMITKMKKSSIIILVALWVNQAFAQHFNTSATLSEIKTNGLHAILVSPEIRSFSKADLEDLRLFGTDQKEVPYYISRDARYTTSVDFENYPLLKKEIIPNRSTHVIIENIGSKAIENIVLNIRNSRLEKTCNISGSNDQKQWFGLLEKCELANLENPNNTHVFVDIKLPKSNYRFLKIQINDSTSAPIDILQVGNFRHSWVDGKLLSVLPTEVLTSTDAIQKKTIIRVRFDQPQVIENIDFQITKPNLYKRKCRITTTKTILKKHSKEEIQEETLAVFDLNSSTRNSIKLPTIFEKEFVIEIENEDNPPLEIKEIVFSQLPIYMVADLKAGENYILKTNNLNLTAPIYDIENFKNQDHATFPTAVFSGVKQIKNTTIAQHTTKSFWQEKWFLWLCIGIAGVTILYFSISLIKEMK